nr:uncharacterized protein LOC112778524 [Arachis hypogaea]
MRKKTIAKRPPREKVYKLPTKPSTRSQDQTFTPSPSPPTSPPCTTPKAQTKTTPRYPVPAKPTPPPKVTPSKPGSSKPGSVKPSSSKGKHPEAEKPVLNQHNPNPGRFLCSLNEWDEGVGISYHDALAHICEHVSLIDGITPTYKALGYERAQLHRMNKGPTRSERVVLDDEDDDFVPEDSPSLSTESTSISTGKKSALLNVDEDPSTDIEEEADSEGNGSNAEDLKALDYSSAGSLQMMKTAQEAHDLIDIVANNEYFYSSERQTAPKKGVFELEGVDTILAQNKLMHQQLQQQIEIMSKRMDGLQLAIVSTTNQPSVV